MMMGGEDGEEEAKSEKLPNRGKITFYNDLESSVGTRIYSLKVIDELL